MRIVFLFLLICCSTISFSQDVLVLRKDEQEVKCRILSMNDSLVTYRLWKSEDNGIYSVKKYDVLSFMMDKKTQKSKAFVDPESITNADNDLLGEYQGGSVVEGYVILENDSLIRGNISVINVAMNEMEIHFSDESGKSKVYTVRDAKAYGYAKVNYERVRTGYKKPLINKKKPVNGTQFLHVAVDGDSKLYRFYTLTFKKSSMSSYNGNPPVYLARLRRHFVITNPKGKQIFTKGRTLKGALNRIYYNYPKFLAENPVEFTTARELPHMVSIFNSWYERNKQQ